MADPHYGPLCYDNMQSGRRMPTFLRNVLSLPAGQKCFMVFWIMLQCSLVGGHQHFRGILHFHDRYFYPEVVSSNARLHLSHYMVS